MSTPVRKAVVHLLASDIHRICKNPPGCHHPRPTGSPRGQLARDGLSCPVAHRLAPRPCPFLKSNIFRFCHPGGHRSRPDGAFVRCFVTFPISAICKLTDPPGRLGQVDEHKQTTTDLIQNPRVDERRRKSTNVYPSRDGVSKLLPARVLTPAR